VKLNIFARRQMPAAGRVLVGNLGKHSKLRRLQHTSRDLYAEHLEASLALAVRAVLQAKRAELFLGDFTAAELLRAFLKAGYFRFDCFAAVSFLDFGGDSDSHNPWPPNLLLRKTPRQKQKSPLNQVLWLVGFGTCDLSYS
jgi:hypothetical protein